MPIVLITQHIPTAYTVICYFCCKFGDSLYLETPTRTGIPSPMVILYYTETVPIARTQTQILIWTPYPRSLLYSVLGRISVPRSGSESVSGIVKVPTRTGKPGNGKAFSSQGKVREFRADLKSQGRSHQILETLGNFRKILFVVLVIFK